MRFSIQLRYGNPYVVVTTKEPEEQMRFETLVATVVLQYIRIIPVPVRYGTGTVRYGHDSLKDSQYGSHTFIF